MREKDIIISTLKSFTPDATIYLFGSRVDDSARGGDIDLFLLTSTPVPLSMKLSMLTRLARSGITRKIDLIVQSPQQQREKLYGEVMEKGVRLC